jgi:hypothetical protein
MIRPLGIVAFEQETPQEGSEAETALAVFGSILGETKSPVLEAIRRYRTVTDQSDEPSLVPMHEVIMRHVIRPLAEAKKCYVLGMPVACIAQAGLVGEMVALWRFRMLREELGRLAADKLKDIPEVAAFDKLGQERRVDVLKEHEPLDAEMVTSFGELRGIRREYMHFMVDEKKNADRDALRAMKHATKLVIRTLGLGIKDGMMVFPPRVMHFIRQIVQG